MHKITNYKYVSFDIFDTLVKREVSNPTEIFDIIQKKYNDKNKKIKNFKENRINAVSLAHSKNMDKEEVTLSEIYEQLEKIYSKAICEKLYKLEIETEINSCFPNYDVVNGIYKDAVKSGKKIIITSDMYLEKDTIERILEKCEIKYDKLYLSSDCGYRKSKGSIFKYIKKDLNIKSGELIHIGDNLISDYIMPRINGFNSIRIIPKSYCSFDYKKVDSHYISDYKNLKSFINTHINSSESYYYKMGYEAFGPILYGFVNMLNEKIDNKNKMFFLSRDGYLMSKAYNIIDNKNKPKYFYASRRALIIPTLWQDDNLEKMLNKLYIRDYIKVENLYRKLGLEKNEYEEIVKKYNYKMNDSIKYNDLFVSPFIDMFNEIKPIIHKNSKKEYELLLAYMKQEGFDNESTLVDIGWNGNMQMAFKNIFKSLNQKDKVKGYYVGVLPESKNIGQVNMNAFLFDEKTNEDIYICLKVINSIFESMFLAPHGSVKTYKKEKNKIVPVLLEYEYSDGIEKQSYEEIQKGALDFISDFVKSDLKNYIDMNPHVSFYSMMQFAYYPRKTDIMAFGDFRFLEDDIVYLAKPKKLSYYLIHPKKLASDLYVSGWVIAFMKRLTKFNFGYTVIYKKMINLYLKRKK